ncbi:hypothetical protein MPQ_0109 [Methylovorus sp. MP688]|nr:hypothetical protein MPQ_0109 [Methylovorus sp. MP688]
MQMALTATLLFLMKHGVLTYQPLLESSSGHFCFMGILHLFGLD